MRTCQKLSRGFLRMESAVLLGVVLAVPAVAWAETVILESRAPGGALTANPPYLEAGGNWGNSTLKSTAAGLTGSGSRFVSISGTPGPGPHEFTMSPRGAQELQTGKSYKVYIAHGCASSIATSNNVFLTVTGGSGLPASTGRFATGTAGVDCGSAWEEIGTVAVDDGPNFSIKFTFDGVPGSSSNRFYADGVRFINTDDLCINTPDVNVTGPLAAGQTFVNVQDVSGSATQVKVYSNGSLIGTANSPFTNAIYHPASKTLVEVQTSALVSGQSITATQVVGGQEGCLPVSSSGPIVGPGTNPALNVVLGVREDAALTGGIDTPSSTASTTVAFIGATGTVGGGFGNGPAGVPASKQISPQKYWQTVSYRRDADPDRGLAADPVWEWAGPNNQALDGNFAQIESIGFGMRSSQDGPYLVFIDDLMNGNKYLRDDPNNVDSQTGFESYTAGNGRPAPEGTTTATPYFQQPSFSGTTTPFLMPIIGPVWPNFTYIADAAFTPPATNGGWPHFEFGAGYADRGTKSVAVHWQYKNTQAQNWLRLTWKTGVQVDLRLPISFRILVLPVNGATPNQPTPLGSPLPTITQQPQNASKGVGESATFSVVASGTGTLHYQWLLNGEPAFGSTDSNSYTLVGTRFSASNPALNDNGSRISVIVRDNNGSVHSDDAILTVTDCNIPFVDFDNDDDVDMYDFQVFQACYDPTQVSPGCKCADVDADGDVDAADFGDPQNPLPPTFVGCASRDQVPSPCLP